MTGGRNFGSARLRKFRTRAESTLPNLPRPKALRRTEGLRESGHCLMLAISIVRVDSFGRLSGSSQSRV